LAKAQCFAPSCPVRSGPRRHSRTGPPAVLPRPRRWPHRTATSPAAPSADPPATARPRLACRRAAWQLPQCRCTRRTLQPADDRGGPLELVAETLRTALEELAATDKRLLVTAGREIRASMFLCPLS
jgi:hypothetical protein